MSARIKILLGAPGLLFFLCLLRLLAPATLQDDEEKFRRAREIMVKSQIAQDREDGAGIRDPRVLEAMRRTARHRFVPANLAAYAYDDYALPIGYGQTISQPFIVAKMTELAQPKPQDRALEVGTGSGYQAAVLASLVAEVYTIEIVEPLGIAARERLHALGYKNIDMRIGDGYQGWPEKAPFDMILVTAGAEQVPPRLIEQLKPEGRMIVPIGKSFEIQMLTLVTKGHRGPRDITVRQVLPVRFVPLVGGPKKN